MWKKERRKCVLIDCMKNIEDLFYKAAIPQLLGHIIISFLLDCSKCVKNFVE